MKTMHLQGEDSVVKLPFVFALTKKDEIEKRMHEDVIGFVEEKLQSEYGDIPVFLVRAF